MFAILERRLTELTTGAFYLVPHGDAFDLIEERAETPTLRVQKVVAHITSVEDLEKFFPTPVSPIEERPVTTRKK